MKNLFKKIKNLFKNEDKINIFYKEVELSLEKRQKIIAKLAKTKDGQAVREWILDLVKQIESVKNIPSKIYEEGGIRLNEEIIGRVWASQYLTSIANKFIILAEENKKTEEDKKLDSYK